MRFTRSLAGFAAALVLAGGFAAASTKHYYGSIAYSEGNGAIGWSYDQRTKQDAINQALSGCYKHADDCITAINFWDGACGAIAVGDNGWGASWGEDMEFASQGALRECQKHTRGCQVKRYQCTSTP